MVASTANNTAEKAKLGAISYFVFMRVSLSDGWASASRLAQHTGIDRPCNPPISTELLKHLSPCIAISIATALVRLGAAGNLRRHAPLSVGCRLLRTGRPGILL